MQPIHLLRLEGVAVLLGGLVGYLVTDAPLWLLLVLALAPDVSMVGYLGGARLGSWTYNLAHTYVLPVALIGTGVALGVELALPVALVWAAHIGADRALGLGLKYETGFRDTHLDRLDAPRGARVEGL
ncbi:MAG: DUF4260 domain-containing protein [Halobacteriales archaeon]